MYSKVKGGNIFSLRMHMKIYQNDFYLDVSEILDEIFRTCKICRANSIGFFSHIILYYIVKSEICKFLHNFKFCHLFNKKKNFKKKVMKKTSNSLGNSTKYVIEEKVSKQVFLSFYMINNILEVVCEI